jgi:hypothetical protein
MTPRLASSKKWTAIPQEFAAQIRTVFEQQFEIEASHGEFLIDGRIYPEEICLSIGYLEKGRLKQINFEASVDLPKTPAANDELDDSTDETNEAQANAQSKTMDHLYTCIDAIGSLMEEYFEIGEDEEEPFELPDRWTPFEFEGSTVYLQQSNVNTKLEQEADRLLGLGEKALVHEDEPSEDALLNASIDTELAKEIQKLIREGKLKIGPDGHLDLDLDDEAKDDKSEPTPH